MNIKRRQFLKTCGLATVATQIPLLTVQGEEPSSLQDATRSLLLRKSRSNNLSSSNTIIKPQRLQVGDTVGLIAPAGTFEPRYIEIVQQHLTNLGLKTKMGRHILDRYGYLAGKDADRAKDVNDMFADDSVQAILAMRGGWGCNRILPLLNYPLIHSHAKILMGYSDITSLLLAINARSRIFTFHGPVATSTWTSFMLEYLKRILFDAEAVTLENTDSPEGKVQTITPGKAQGQLIGGNLSVLSAMVGSPYLPAWQNRILFLEDVNEDIYRVDRMLTQLKNAGILYRISGFIFGQCTDCKPTNEKSLTLMEVLQDHIIPLKIPAWYGAMIGHIQDKFILPIGANVEIDADAGTIQLLEAAVN
ncbi:S66 peptidase family protein [Nostoc parmelioides]|uniref:LD-carboxypeptidase n=1 Tax=Nostoc parmelioides FACHB-3921 TaxID=2692909 RepID=A0ABR8BJF7_9NOSO|nr:LD-carboxypeptidase [Nostoc parmelioides]MBD2253267.1 LD-carboxypeptidase [Nostoc parmelioides FACHB-3921]